MDNLGAHKVDGVRDLIEQTGASLCYLPPYSPDFNPLKMPPTTSTSAAIPVVIVKLL
jgi:hypothetical protein